jgi:hypothetical protein
MPFTNCQVDDFLKEDEDSDVDSLARDITKLTLASKFNAGDSVHPKTASLLSDLRIAHFR